MFNIPSHRSGVFPRSRQVIAGAACALAAFLAGSVQAQNLTVTNGLQLWLKADAGVTTNASGAVTGWADQSGQGNHATQPDETAAPGLTAAALNGKPAVHFDGDNDYLDVATAPSIEIVGDISSFFVVKFDDFANYRAVWGKTLVNIPASTDYYITPEGIPRAYRGSGDVSDIGSADSTVRPKAGNFIVLGFGMEGTILTHYLNEQPAGSGEITATPVDGATPLKIGSRDDLFTKMKGDIAELLIYDRALSETERGSAVNYLQTKYGITNQAPSIAFTSPANNGTVTVPGTLTLRANVTDADGTISKVDFFANGSLIATATSSPYSVPVLIQTGGPITFTARATDNKDGIGTAAPITITASGGPTAALSVTNGLQLWLKADVGVTNQAGTVTGWADQSGNGNHATQADATMAPLLSETGFGGKPALHFDGEDDYLNVTSAPSIAITGDITSFFAVRFDDFASFRAVWGKTAGNVPRPTDYYLVPGSGIPRVFRGSDETGVNQFVDGAGGVPTNAPALLGFSQTGTLMTHYFNGQPFGSGQMTVVPTDSGADLKIGSRDDFATKMRGDIAELLIFDRGVSGADAAAIATYLGGKYGIAIVQLTNTPPTVAITEPAGSSSFTAPTNITVTATATDPDGGIARVDFYADGGWIGSDSTAPYRATANLLLGGQVVLTAVATDNLGTSSTSAGVAITASSSTPTPLPATAALKLWLKADEGVAADTTGTVTNWTDFSGNGNHATQTNSVQAPHLQANAFAGLPALQFDGEDDFLQVAHSATLALTDDLTTFFVMNVDDFTTFRAVWAKTESNQPRPWDYYLLPDSGIPRAIHGGPVGIGSVDATEAVTNGFMIVGFEMAANTLTHYFAERAVGSGTIAAAGFDAGTPLLIGTRADGATRLKGHLAELIIYNAALSDAARAQVVHYLQAKYFGVDGQEQLTVRRTGDSIVLAWGGTGTLQQADSVTGPWSPVTAATNPYTVVIAGQQKFYRIGP